MLYSNFKDTNMISNTSQLVVNELLKHTNELSIRVEMKNE